MPDDPPNAEPHGPSTAPDMTDPEVGPVCAFCGGPMPPAALDEHGHRKAGRPARYCRKACADAASRARRQRQAATISAHLAAATQLSDTARPGLSELTAVLTELTRQLEQAQNGALAEVEAAEEEAAEARNFAEAAEQRATQAERAHRQALAAERAAQQKRLESERRLEDTRTDAERTRTEAWQQVAEHEAARGRAEAARDAALSARADLIDQRDTALRSVDELRAAQLVQAKQLEAVRRALAEARAACDTHTARLTLVEQALTETVADKEMLREQVSAALVRAETAETERDRARAQAEQAAAEARGEIHNLRADADRQLALITAAHQAELAALRASAQDARVRAERAEAQADAAELQRQVLARQLHDLRAEPDISSAAAGGQT
ncbi:hypothetical protein Pph01_69170 [Planotetraspora phitsanulokensis]|uniref:Chromosome segregation ATPase n=2 Tax=Planotetraspora phitsanulokensis TaxID=575192 RepID=A0A8J3XI21_9ACTN|nr:hypothetical protein Pph01_69170 [Planotetraspora phitsanulokensis]